MSRKKLREPEARHESEKAALHPGVLPPDGHQPGQPALLRPHRPALPGAAGGEQLPLLRPAPAQLRLSDRLPPAAGGGAGGYPALLRRPHAGADARPLRPAGGAHPGRDRPPAGDQRNHEAAGLPGPGGLGPRRRRGAGGGAPTGAHFSLSPSAGGDERRGERELRLRIRRREGNPRRLPRRSSGHTVRRRLGLPLLF